VIPSEEMGNAFDAKIYAILMNLKNVSQKKMAVFTKMENVNIVLLLLFIIKPKQLVKSLIASKLILQVV